MPIFILGLIFFLLYFFLRDVFLKEVEVEITRATLYPDNSHFDIDGNSSGFKKGSLLFQASGWIEPDPFPIKVTSLYSGVVKEVHVLEGQKIRKGEVIAKLINEDAQLALNEITAIYSQSIAEESIIQAEIDIEQAGLAAALSRVKTQEALVQKEKDALNRISALPQGMISEQVLFQTKLACDKQSAELETSHSEVNRQKALIYKLEKSLFAQKKKTEIFSIQKQKSELDLNRTEITSPIDGIVLRLLAKPGSRMMLHMDDMDAAAAAIMFEEGKLQARIDVPLSEAAKINLGQIVEVTSSILPEEVFRGNISRILGEADLQRNTLQVKVSLNDTHPKLRPEMLCRAKFYGIAHNTDRESSKLKIFLNKNHISIKPTDTDSQKDVWIISKDGKRCEKRNITLGSTVKVKGENIEVIKGLLPGDQVIVNPPLNLTEGDRVKIINSI